MPKTLHKELAQEAEIEGMSLNAFVVSLLSKKYGEHIARTTVNFIAPMPQTSSNNSKYEDNYEIRQSNKIVELSRDVRMG